MPSFPRYLAAAIVAVGMAAVGGCAEPEPVRLPEARPSHGEARIAFTDVTEAAGLAGFHHETGAAGEMWFPETMGSGGGFIDYDGDGNLDVLLVGGGAWDAAQPVRVLWLYHNNGDGTFTLASKAAGLEETETYGLGITVADYDNDNDQDFFLTTLDENLLFRNDGGVFTEVGRTAGVAGDPVWSSAGVFFDADRDGWLDLYVGNYVDWSPEKDVWCSLTGQDKGYCTPEVYESVPGRFYRNNGDGTFTDQTEVAGFAGTPGNTLGAAMLDFNRDGWPDLAVANDLQRDLLFVNNGDGTFTERGMLSGIAYDQNGRAQAGMGIDAGDADNDGRATVFVGNFSHEMIGVYRHEGNGVFVNRAAISRIGRPSLRTLAFGMFLFDADLDTDLDLFVANGHVQKEIARVQDGVTYRQPPHLFMNRGDGTFEDRGGEAGAPFSRPLVARGAAYADLDGDGDLDILVTENGGGAYLWRNEARKRDMQPGSTAGRHFLRVRLEGTEGNRDGIGARLVAVTGAVRMERYVRTGSSYLSQSEKTTTFGLGTASQVDSMMVYWPSGQVDRAFGVAADQEVRIVEGKGVVETGTHINDEVVATR